MRSLAVAVALSTAWLASSAVASPSVPSATGGIRSAHLMDEEAHQVSPRFASAADLQLPPDSHAGSIVPGEAALGLGFLLVADFVSAFAGVAVFLGMFIIGGDILGSTGLWVAGLVWAGLELAFSPLLAAFGATLVAGRARHNGVGGAFLGAFAVQLVAGAAVGGWIWSANAAGGPTMLSNVLAIAALAIHFLGVPVGASLGIHWGGRAADPSTPSSPTSPRGGIIAQLPTRPTELYRAATPSVVSPLVAWTF